MKNCKHAMLNVLRMLKQHGTDISHIKCTARKAAMVFVFAAFIACAATPALASGLKAVSELYGGQGAGTPKTGEVLNEIYFGNYWQTLKSGATAGSTNLSDYNYEGIKWRVLATDAPLDPNDSTKTGILLLSDQALYADAFQKDGSTSIWRDSEIRDTLQEEDQTTFNEDGTVATWGGFAGDAFNAKEYAAIADTTHIAGGPYPNSEISTTEKLFLLSKEEAESTAYGFLDKPHKIAASTDLAKNVNMYGNTGVSSGLALWRLRSPGYGGYLGGGAYGIYSDGYVAFGTDVKLDSGAVRAALNLDQESVLFLSAAVDGKGVVNVGDGFALNNAYTGANGWKLTLKDAYDATSNPTGIKKPNVTKAEVVGATWDVNDLAETAKSGTKIIKISDQTPTGDEGLKIAYNGAKTGKNMYVSALLKDSGGNYVNYAKVSDLAADTKIIDISNINAGNYTLCIYGEQENGNYQTDYASDLKELTITIPIVMPAPTINTVLSRTYAADGLIAEISNSCELGFKSGEYDTSVTVTDGETGKITADATNGTTLTGDITVGNAATLTTTNTFTLTGTNSINGSVTGGYLTISGGTTTVESTGSIGNNITIQTGGTLETNADKYLADDGVKSVTMSGGTLKLTGGTLAKAITGTGTTNIAGEVTANAKIDTTLAVGTNGQLTASANDLGGSVTNSGTINFTGGTLENSYTSTGGTANFGFAAPNNTANIPNNIASIHAYNPASVRFAGAVTLTNSTLNFCLDNFSAGDTIIETAQKIDLADARITLTQTDAAPDYKLGKGQTMTLITKAENYTGKDKLETRDGVTKYLYRVGIRDEALMLGYLYQELADQTKSFSEARLAGAAALNSGSDLIATEVIDSIEEIKAAKGWEAFAAMKATHSRYDTGSHITLNSYNIAAGVSKKIGNAVTLGIFAEVGNGSYSTVNEFKDGNVNADGDIDYYGGGLLAKAEGKKTTMGQLYAEASVRAGHIKSDYNSDNFAIGSHTNFDTSGSYIGAHAGIGYKWAMKDGADIDTYIKYLWNRQNGDSPTIHGDKFDLNDINSHRLRVGLRYNSKPNSDSLKFFAGLAYEHEFDGTAKGTMGEYALLEPDFTGGSARMELGIKYDKKESPWKVELGLTGYAGKRESIGATLNAWYEFGGKKQKAEIEATEVTETTATETTTETTETTATETTKAE